MIMAAIGDFPFYYTRGFCSIGSILQYPLSFIDFYRVPSLLVLCMKK